MSSKRHRTFSGKTSVNRRVADALMGVNGRQLVIKHETTLSAVRPAVAPGLDVDGIRAIFDQAEQGNTDDLFRLYADIVYSDPDVIAALTQRTAGFISKPWNLVMPKNASALMKDNTERLKRQFDQHAGFNGFLPQFPIGGLWPVAMGRQTYKTGTRGNYYDVDKITVMPWTRWDFTGGLSEKPAGTLGVKCLTASGEFDAGKLIWPERERGEPCRGWIVHRGNMLSDFFPDAWGGPLRAAVMWWFFGIQCRQLWANYVERGAYLLVGKHEANDDKGRDELLSAFDEAQRVSGVVVNNETEVAVHNLASQGGGQAHQALMKYCSDQVLKVISGGTTLTVNAAAAGMGGGNQAATQRDTQGDVFVMDTVFAARTIKAQIFAPFLTVNGGDASEMPDLSWGGDSEDQGALATRVKDLKAGGLRPTAAALPELSERLGFAVEWDAAGPAVTPVPGNPAPAAGSVADVSLNGAQITALLDVVARVAAGQLSRAGALSLIAAAFPSVSPERAQQILAGALAAPPANAFAASGIAPGRQKLIAAALLSSDQVTRAAAAELARAGRGQFAGLDAALRNADTAEEALAAADSWLATFSPDPIAAAMEHACAAHAANGHQKSAAVAGLPSGA